MTIDYLANFDRVVMKKCEEYRKTETATLNNIALGRVERSLGGGYVSKSSKQPSSSRMETLDKHKENIRNIFKHHGYYIDLKEAHTEEQVDDIMADFFDGMPLPDWLNEIHVASPRVSNWSNGTEGYHNASEIARMRAEHRAKNPYSLHTISGYGADIPDTMKDIFKIDPPPHIGGKD